MTLLVIHLFQAVQVDVDGTDLLILHLLVGFQPLDVAVAVVQAGEHVAVAELFQIGLLLFAVQTVGHKELDGRQQGRVIVVRAGVVHTQKAHHGSAFHQRHGQQAPHLLRLQHLVAGLAPLLLQIGHIIGTALPEVLHPDLDDRNRHLLQIVHLGTYLLPADVLKGVDEHVPVRVDLKHIGAVGLKIAVHSGQQVVDAHVDVGVGVQLAHAAVQHGGDLQTLADLLLGPF